MPADPQITVILQDAAHEVLMWVGFGTLVGLAAKAIMPGRDPGGALGTMLMGIVGSVLGCGVHCLSSATDIALCRSARPALERERVARS